MTWTPARIEKLKELWTEGLSAAEIANELGNTTRNAVIGIVHRRGFQPRKTKHHKNPYPRTRKRKKNSGQPHHLHGASPSGGPAPSPSQANGAPARSLPLEEELLDEFDAINGYYDLEPEAEATPEDTDPDFIGPPFRMTVATMPTFGACRWPYGDGPFFFCGVPCAVTETYCEAHQQIAYSPAPTRRKSKNPQPDQPAKLNFGNEERYG